MPSTSPPADVTPARRGPRTADARPRPRWPLAALVAVAALSLGWWVTRSPLFQLRTVEVSGTSALSRGEVIASSGLRAGANVLWLSTGEVVARLERHPWIAEAEVVRSLPATVRIAIRERAPVATVADGSRWLLVAEDGTILGREADDPGLPALALEGGTAVSSLAAPARAVAAMPRWLRSQVDVVVVRGDGTLALELASGASVLYGDPSSVRAKAEALAAVVRWAGREGVALDRVDVRAPLAPAATVALPGGA